MPLGFYDFIQETPFPPSSAGPRSHPLSAVLLEPSIAAATATAPEPAGHLGGCPDPGRLLKPLPQSRSHGKATRQLRISPQKEASPRLCAGRATARAPSERFLHRRRSVPARVPPAGTECAGPGHGRGLPAKMAAAPRSAPRAAPAVPPGPAGPGSDSAAGGTARGPAGPSRKADPRRRCAGRGMGPHGAAGSARSAQGGDKGERGWRSGERRAGEPPWARTAESPSPPPAPRRRRARTQARAARGGRSRGARRSGGRRSGGGGLRRVSGRPRADRDLPPPPSRGAGPARPWSRRRSSSSSGRSRSGHGGGGAATPAPGEGGAARGLSAARAGRGRRGGSGGPGCQARSGAGRDEWARQGAGPPSAHRARARRRRGGIAAPRSAAGFGECPRTGAPGRAASLGRARAAARAPRLRPQLRPHRGLRGSRAGPSRQCAAPGGGKRLSLKPC